MKILVTGASGFVGKNLIKHLNKYNINILSRKKIFGDGVFVGDLFDKKILLDASKVDIIIHLAGISNGDVFKINYEGTRNLVDACVENKVKKFIFISSFDAILETDYGKSKLKAEDYIKNSGLNYIIFRPTVIYGNDNKKDIGRLIRLIKMGISPIPGSGNFKLQPVFVDDIVKIIAMAIESKHKNKTYFIGGADVLSFNELADKIASQLNKKIVKINIPIFLVKLINKSLLSDKICSNAEIEKNFKFKTKKFEDGIKKSLHDF